MINDNVLHKRMQRFFLKFDSSEQLEPLIRYSTKNKHLVIPGPRAFHLRTPKVLHRVALLERYDADSYFSSLLIRRLRSKKSTLALSGNIFLKMLEMLVTIFDIYLKSKDKSKSPSKSSSPTSSISSSPAQDPAADIYSNSLQKLSSNQESCEISPTRRQIVGNFKKGSRSKCEDRANLSNDCLQKGDYPDPGLSNSSPKGHYSNKNEKNFQDKSHRKVPTVSLSEPHTSSEEQLVYQKHASPSKPNSQSSVRDIGKTAEGGHFTDKGRINSPNKERKRAPGSAKGDHSHSGNNKKQRVHFTPSNNACARTSVWV